MMRLNLNLLLKVSYCGFNPVSNVWFFDNFSQVCEFREAIG
jgi:hypothetical protein